MSLKEAREARGIKQKSVAEALGITRQKYAEFEKAPQQMRVEQVEKACNFMGYSLDDISFFASDV